MEEQSLSLLYIGDSEPDLELVKAEIVRGGYKVNARQAKSSEELHKAFQALGIDIIIFDYDTEFISAQEARSIYQSYNIDIPIIVIAKQLEDDAVYLLKQGANDLVCKSSLDRLVSAIQDERIALIARQQRRQVKAQLKVLSRAVEHSPNSVVISDPNGVIEYVNPKFEEVSGYSFEDAIGKEIGLTLHKETKDKILVKLWANLREHGKWTGEAAGVRKNGDIFWERLNISAIKNKQGEVTQYVTLKQDITDKYQYEEQLRQQAHYDPLTGLPNRVLMADRMESAITLSARECKQAYLLCLDLDNFKKVNDSAGHASGDALLKTAAKRIESCIRKTDTLARMGGDEFMVVLPNVLDAFSIKMVAQRIIESIAKPYTIDGVDHFITTSIGIAKCPDDGRTSQELMSNADLAMYQAKEAGKNRYRFFSDDITKALKEKLHIERALRDVDYSDEFELHYQVIVEPATQKVVAYEALVRWCKDGNMVPPDLFIPIAESSGLIVPLGKWILKRAFEDYYRLRKSSSNDIKCAINISPRQLQEASFWSYVKNLMAAYDLDAKNIEFEITETVIMTDGGDTKENLKQLCNMGISLSIDDFGTGYSSLAYLQKYPFSVLKIDRGFVNEIEDNQGNTRLTDAMINMAHSLGLKVIAEGVENKQQLKILQKLDCDYIQGYFVSKPVPYKDLVEKIRQCDALQMNHKNVAKM